MSAHPIYRLGSVSQKARFAGARPATWSRIEHLLNECGERIAPKIADALLEFPVDSRQFLDRLSEFEVLYSHSVLSHTDEVHDDGYVRLGAERKFLEELHLSAA